jgi:hypothetical protein
MNRTISSATATACQIALMDAVADYNARIYRCVWANFDPTHWLRARDEVLNALRELSPGLATAWSGKRYES